MSVAWGISEIVWTDKFFLFSSNSSFLSCLWSHMEETVKITIPSLDQFKDEEPEPETKVKPKFKSGSGLLSFLPPPKNSGSSEKCNFTPYVLTKKKEFEKKPQAIKSSLGKPFVNKNKQISPVVKTISSKTESISEDVSNNDDDDNYNTPTSDFFSLESNNNKIEIEGVNVLHTEQSDKSSLFSSLPEPAQTSDSYYMSSHQEIESPSIPVASAQGISNVEEYNWNETYDTANDQTDTLSFIEDERFKKIKGRKEPEGINIIDVNADDQLSGKDEWLMQSLTEERVQRPSKRRHDMPTQLQKRKHQITYLAYQAKERELDLKNQWALNRLTRYNPNIEWFCSAKLVLELLAAVHMLHLYFGTWDTGTIITLRHKASLGYADTLQDFATGWSNDDSTSESEKEI
ncbi:proline-rich protein PRCC [Trichonephila clavata]|uniref:Proline-rich protein PRCC n=1 Tax=Trichonephila clavata TaxID=2740835 RepID=A0A8X6GD33_TRICU|nr:proline-rich protein PRCC [Trichonephila clavata]